MRIHNEVVMGRNLISTQCSIILNELAG